MRARAVLLVAVSALLASLAGCFVGDEAPEGSVEAPPAQADAAAQPSERAPLSPPPLVPVFEPLEPLPDDAAGEGDAANATANATNATAQPPEEPAWPRNGSFVRYHFQREGGRSGGAYRVGIEGDLALRYEGDRWWGTCGGDRGLVYVPPGQDLDLNLTRGRQDYRMQNVSFLFSVSHPALQAFPEPAAGNQSVVPTIAGACDLARMRALAAGREAHALPGADAAFDAWRMRYDPRGPENYTAWVDTRIGLVLEWNHTQRQGVERGWVVATDAPLLPRALPPPEGAPAANGTADANATAGPEGAAEANGTLAAHVSPPLTRPPEARAE